jgi:DnaJ-class molecular chaperone
VVKISAPELNSTEQRTPDNLLGRVRNSQHTKFIKMPRHNHYFTLGAAQGASKQQIKQAWARKVLETQPDTTLDNDAKAFRRVQEDFEVWRHDSSRAEHDATTTTVHAREATIFDVSGNGEEVTPFKPA